MFGHGQHDNGTQNTSQSSWAASSRAQQEPTPPEQLQAQQFYSDVGHYRQYTLTNPAHAGHYDYSTNAEQNLTQQRHLQEQPGEREPPNSAGSVGSGSVSSGESAATTGPSTVSQQPNIHYSHESLPQTPSSTSHQAPSSASFAQNNASMQGSPLFAVPPGYRTMLSSDKLSAALQPFDSSAEVGGSAPVRHNSMPSSIVSTSAGPPRSSGEISGTPQSQHTYHSPSQPPSQHHSQHVSYTQPPTPSSITHPFLHAPVPHYLSGSAPILQSSLTQEPLQHQLPGPSPHQSHFHSSSSSASGSGSSSLAAHSGSSASSGNQSSVSSDTGPLAKHSRYPRRHLHQSEDIGQTSVSQPLLYHSTPDDAHFVSPAPPTSAPATTTTFAISGFGSGEGSGRQGQGQGQGQSGTTRPDGHNEAHNNFIAHSLSSSTGTGIDPNPSSATHSRSPSVSSTTLSSFGPLSASTSSSASSFGEFPAASSTPRRAMRLSNLDRRALCQYAEANPRVKHEHIGSMFGVERSTVSKILKQKAKWFSVSDDNTIPVSPTTDRKTKDGKPYKNRVGRYPEMEAMLLEWGKEQTRSNVVLSDEAVRSKALEFAEQLNIESGSFKASAGWLENFKDRAKYKAGKFDLTALPPSLTQSSASSRDPSEEAMDGSAEPSGNTANEPPDTSNIPFDRHSMTKDGLLADSLPIHLQPVQTPISRASSPLRHRRHKRGGLSSLSSSSISLPDLAEQEERRSINMSKPGSSVDLRSRGSSFSNLSMQPLSRSSKDQPTSVMSYSTDSSPYPSPTCSTGSELSQSLPTAAQPASTGFVAHTSTPTQRTVYDGAHTPQSGGFRPRETDSTAPLSSRLQQAGINFNLSLNSSPVIMPQQHQHLPTIEAGQALDFRHLDAHHAEAGAFSSVYQGTSDAYHGDTIYTSRSRIHSAPGSSFQPHVASFVPNVEGVGGHLHAHAYSYGQSHATSPTHQEQYLLQHHKVPLHRSQTDPMPLYSSTSVGNPAESSMHAEHLGDSTLTAVDAVHAGDSSSMQIDSAHHAFQDDTTHSHIHQYIPQISQVYAQVPHARRATVSSGGDLSFSSGSGTTSSQGHGHSYSMSAVTTPVFGSFAAATSASVTEPARLDGSSKVSLHEAYLSLHRVVTFLQDNDVTGTSRARLATSSQTEALEALLLQLKQAHIAQIPTLTPPKSL